MACCLALRPDICCGMASGVTRRLTMAIVTNAVRHKQAQEAAERRDPTISLARQEQAAAWEEMQVLCPVVVEGSVVDIEAYRCRRAHEIEDASRGSRAVAAIWAGTRLGS